MLRAKFQLVSGGESGLVEPVTQANSENPIIGRPNDGRPVVAGTPVIVDIQVDVPNLIQSICHRVGDGPEIETAGLFPVSPAQISVTFPTPALPPASPDTSLTIMLKYADGSSTETTVPVVVVLTQAETEQQPFTKFTEPETQIPAVSTDTPQTYPVDLPPNTTASEICIMVGTQEYCLSAPFGPARPILVPYQTPNQPGPVLIVPTVKYPDNSTIVGPSSTVNIAGASEAEIGTITFADPRIPSPKAPGSTQDISILLKVNTIATSVVIDIDGVEFTTNSPFASNTVLVNVTWGNFASSPQTVIQKVRYADSSEITSAPVQVTINSEAATTPVVINGPGNSLPPVVGVPTTISIDIPTPNVNVDKICVDTSLGPVCLSAPFAGGSPVEIPVTFPAPAGSNTFTTEVTFNDGSVTTTVTPITTVGTTAESEGPNTTFVEPVPLTPPATIGQTLNYPISLPVPSTAVSACVDVGGVEFCVPGIFADSPRPILVPYTLPGTPGDVPITPVTKYGDGSEYRGPTTTYTVSSEALNEEADIVWDDPVNGDGSPKAANTQDTISVVVPIPTLADQICVALDGVETCVAGPFLTSPVAVGPITWGTAADSPQQLQQLVKFPDGSIASNTPTIINIESQAASEAANSTLGPLPNTATTPIRAGEETTIPVDIVDPTLATSITFSPNDGSPDIVLTPPYSRPIEIPFTWNNPGVFIPVVVAVGYADGSSIASDVAAVTVVSQADAAATNEITYTGMAATETVAESVAHVIGITYSAIPFGLDRMEMKWGTDPVLPFSNATVTGAAGIPINSNKTYAVPGTHAVTITSFFVDGSTAVKTSSLEVGDSILAATQATSSLAFDATPTFGNANAYLTALAAAIGTPSVFDTGLTEVRAIENTLQVEQNLKFAYTDIDSDLTRSGANGDDPYLLTGSVNEAFIVDRRQQIEVGLSTWISANKNNSVELDKLRDANFVSTLFGQNAWSWVYDGQMAGRAEFYNEVSFTGMDGSYNVQELGSHTVGINILTTTSIRTTLDRAQVQFHPDAAILIDNTAITAAPKTHTQEKIYTVVGGNRNVEAIVFYTDGSSIGANSIITVIENLTPKVAAFDLTSVDTPSTYTDVEATTVIIDLIKDILSIPNPFSEYEYIKAAVPALAKYLAVDSTNFGGSLHADAGHLVNDMPHFTAPDQGYDNANSTFYRRPEYLRWYPRVVEYQFMFVDWLAVNKNNPTEIEKLKSPTFEADMFAAGTFVWSHTWTDIATSVDPFIATKDLGAAAIATGATDTVQLNFNGYGGFLHGVSTIDWGDGSPVGTIPANLPAIDNGSLAYVYTVAGSYTKIMTITWDDGSVATETLGIVVS